MIGQIKVLYKPIVYMRYSFQEILNFLLDLYKKGNRTKKHIEQKFNSSIIFQIFFS